MERLTWLTKATGTLSGDYGELHRDSGSDFCTDGFRVHVVKTTCQPIKVLAAMPSTAPAVAVWVYAGELYEAARRAMGAVGSSKPDRCYLYLALPEEMIVCLAAAFIADAAAGFPKEAPCQIMAWAPQKPLIINDPEHCALIMPSQMITADRRIDAMRIDGTVLAVAHVNGYPFLAGRLVIEEKQHPRSGFVPGWPLDENGVCHAPESAPVKSVEEPVTLTLINEVTGEVTRLS